MSTNVKEVVSMAVEYGVEHLGRSMAVAEALSEAEREATET